MEEYFKELVRIRRELHKIPETAYNEKETGKYILKYLNELGIFNITEMAKTGFVADYNVNDREYIAFRTDMDALKITEETGLEFSSEKEGFMHACGHDLHMSMMLVLAKWINDNRPQKNIMLIFQPAEEGFGGGELMVKEGIFDNFAVKEIYALHNTTEYPLGVIALNKNKMFAGTIEFEYRLKGKGGHAAVPHLNNDLVTASAHAVTLLNTIVPRFLDPVDENVLSIGMVQAGEAANILPSTAVIKGTARSYRKEWLEKIKGKLEDIRISLEKLFGIECELIFHTEYIPAINDPLLADKILKSKVEGIEIIECDQKMTGEDFGFMQDVVPGVISWLGAGNGDNRDTGLHNQCYSPDERSMEKGLQFYIHLLNQFN